MVLFAVGKCAHPLILEMQKRPRSACAAFFVFTSVTALAAQTETFDQVLVTRFVFGSGVIQKLAAQGDHF